MVLACPNRAFRLRLGRGFSSKKPLENPLFKSVSCVPPYKFPPVIRFTNIGLREVDKNLKETAQALGLKPLHILRLIELSLARNVILGGVNQTVMMALSMVVIASMIGVRGLGAQVMQAIGNGYLGLGVISGLSIVALAIIMDRSIQSYNKRYDKWRDHK